MPIPQPNSGENRDEFMSRCMSDSVMVNEYPNRSQRYAVCSAQLSKKARSWQTIDRERATFRQRSRKPMFNLLSSQINPIIEYLNEGRDIESLYDRDIIIDEQPIIKTYEKMYADAGVYFGMKERKRLKNEDDIYRGLLYEEMIKLANSELIAQNIKVVGETSKEIIQRLLRQLIPEVIEEGAGMQQAATMLRDRIESQWHTFARFRTERIVRTEITTASNAGSLTGVKSTGIPVKKVWVATFDSNTRDPHAEANGQKVDKDDYFIVNGEQMEYPGDPAGSAGNVINCRCAMSYETV